ncbi:MAG TPA: SEC-C metal-binding domain-containing protein, partial [Caldilinea sp.]|nr:SEC-C metal-binding domain-containing protein [Caldilinea sp.]
YKPIIRADHDDLVYRTQEPKFKAVLEDIKEKYQAGQPVLVGTVAIETSEYVSNLLKRNGIPHEVLNAKNHEREATIIAQAGRPGAVTIATNMAGRGVDILLGGNAEGLAREQLRKEQIDLSAIHQNDWNRAIDMLKHRQEPTTAFDDRWAAVVAEQWHAVERDKEAVRGLGGLHVVGTERHEARRIDNQLRGRSGRLGDPGSSRFYLSLEDELMRKFGGERISGVMARLGVEDDVPIEAGLVNKAIENAQTKVEGYNFDIRKHVLRYDEVVNEQRNRIYDQRRRILTEPSLRLTVEDMVASEVRVLVAEFTVGEYEDEWQLDELTKAVRALAHHVPADLGPERWHNKKRSEIEADAIALAHQAYAAKEVEVGEAILRNAEKQIMLWAVDSRWVRHLTDLDRLREGIGLRALAQQDPVVAYKREAFEMYNEMIEAIRSDTVRAVFSVQLQRQQAQQAAPPPPTSIARNIRTNRGDGGGDSKPQTMRKSGPELGRNDLCWCGSGKKYKSCHMKSDQKEGATPQRVAAK